MAHHLRSLTWAPTCAPCMVSKCAGCLGRAGQEGKREVTRQEEDLSLEKHFSQQIKHAS